MTCSLMIVRLAACAERSHYSCMTAKQGGHLLRFVCPGILAQGRYARISDGLERFVWLHDPVAT